MPRNRRSTMATMNERKLESIKKEIEKLNKSLARYNTILAKKVSKCESLNCNWSRDEFFEHRDVDMNDDQYNAYFEKAVAEHDVEDTERRISNAESRLSKMMPKAEADALERQEQERVTTLERSWLKQSTAEREADYQRWLTKFKADCLKDGIIIDHATNNFIDGQTARGERFVMYINNGFTERSLHCYTLMINGLAVFTSGDFSTGYARIKRR